MKQRINNWTRLFYGFLMTILGFSGCDLIEFGRMEYGQPHAEFKIAGEVKSQAGTPLKGIRVTINPRPGEPNDWSRYSSDTLFTDAGGKYSKDRLKYNWPDELKEAEISFEDIDGPENGGEFETVKLTSGEFSVKQTKKGDGNWNEGAYSVTANATMSLKKKD
ncbi:MAG: radical SAM-associated putative lipoprotein [Bacteroidales bacterium]|nr:radical SAM-associated putative lipoprotein [Bacteroidales bacterium]